MRYRKRKLYKLLKSDPEMASEYVLDHAGNGSKLRAFFSVLDDRVHANVFLVDELSETRVGLARNDEMRLFNSACDEYDQSLKKNRE